MDKYMRDVKKKYNKNLIRYNKAVVWFTKQENRHIKVKSDSEEVKIYLNIVSNLNECIKELKIGGYSLTELEVRNGFKEIK